MADVNVIFIGRHFYWESGTFMSSMYTEAGARYDLGKLETDLAAGLTVEMRPATDAEYGFYERQLRTMKAERESRATPSA